MIKRKIYKKAFNHPANLLSLWNFIFFSFFWLPISPQDSDLILKELLVYGVLLITLELINKFPETKNIFLCIFRGLYLPNWINSCQYLMEKYIFLWIISIKLRIWTQKWALYEIVNDVSDKKCLIFTKFRF